MKKVTFWTKEEDDILRNALSKFKNDRQASIWVAKQINRTQISVYNRIRLLENERYVPRYVTPRNIEKIRVSKKKVEQPEAKGVTLPAGFTFDIKPARVVLFEDHVRMYY